jgi:glutamate N-acetyltransferase/amino-acid N-acetyltransferase
MSPSALPLPAGFRAAGVHAGLKAEGKLDVAVIRSDRPAAVAGRVTTNAVKAAPARHTEAALKAGRPIRAIVVNTKNANALNGRRGMQDLGQIVEASARLLRVKPAEVLMHSTGVIGVPMPVEKIIAGVRAAVPKLSADGGMDAATAILTTDLVAKTSTRVVTVGGVTGRVTGFAKGSGMIHPCMATMLAYVLTDLDVPRPLLDRIVGEAVDRSFNSITVDGDTSTNDTVLLLANGAAGNKPLKAGTPAAKAFAAAVQVVFLDLAVAIVRDGEGATKFVTITVKGAKTDAEAKKAAKAVANSPLVKTALFGADPNWGRILAAVGYSGARVDEFKARVAAGGYTLYDGGRPVDWSRDRLREIFSAKEIDLLVELRLGKGAATVYTCDLSYDYVKINGEYTT